jgi:hypothetical protein
MLLYDRFTVIFPRSISKHCCPVNFFKMRFLTSFEMTMSDLGFKEGLGLRRSRKPSPSHHKPYERACHPERSEGTNDFPRTTVISKEKNCLRCRKERMYIDSRYQLDYSITKEELEYLSGCVTRLCNLTEID